MDDWQLWETGGEMFHIIPANDLREHSRDGVKCWCKPEDDDGVIVHNSMDGREKFETGERRPS